MTRQTYFDKAVIDVVTYFAEEVIEALTYFIKELNWRGKLLWRGGNWCGNSPDEKENDAVTYFDKAVIDSAVEPRVPVPRLLGKHDGVLGTVLGQGDQPQRRPELGRIVVDVQHRDVDLSVAWTAEGVEQTILLLVTINYRIKKLQIEKLKINLLFH